MIRRFLRRLGYAWLLAEALQRPAGALPTAEPQWEPEDARDLAHFLGTRAGARLRQRFADAEGALLRAAVEAASGRPYECGRASGFRATVAILYSLSAPLDAHSSNLPEESGDFALPPDMDPASELRARMSP